MKMTSQHSRFWTMLFLVCAVSIASTVGAQPNVEKSMPADNAVLDTMPKRVTFWFSEKVNPEHSSIEVFDSNDERVDDGKTMTSEGRNQISIRLSEIFPGQYTAKWKVVSVEGHATDGQIAFQVR